MCSKFGFIFWSQQVFHPRCRGLKLVLGSSVRNEFNLSFTLNKFLASFPRYIRILKINILPKNKIYNFDIFIFYSIKKNIKIVLNEEVDSMVVFLLY